MLAAVGDGAFTNPDVVRYAESFGATGQLFGDLEAAL